MQYNYSKSTYADITHGGVLSLATAQAVLQVQCCDSHRRGPGSWPTRDPILNSFHSSPELNHDSKLNRLKTNLDSHCDSWRHMNKFQYFLSCVQWECSLKWDLPTQSGALAQTTEGKLLFNQMVGV